MTAIATGPTNVLADGGGAPQIGFGTSGEALMLRQGAEANFVGNATITPAQLKTTLINYVGAGHNLTLPLATDLDAALPNAGVDSAFDFSVIATTGTATLVTNTGWTIVGRLTTAAATASRYRARRTAAGAWTLYLIG